MFDPNMFNISHEMPFENSLSKKADPALIYLFAQSQPRLEKDEDIRTISLASYWCLYC